MKTLTINAKTSLMQHTMTRSSSYWVGYSLLSTTYTQISNKLSMKEKWQFWSKTKTRWRKIMALCFLWPDITTWVMPEMLVYHDNHTRYKVYSVYVSADWRDENILPIGATNSWSHPIVLCSKLSNLTRMMTHFTSLNDVFCARKTRHVDVTMATVSGECRDTSSVSH